MAMGLFCSRANAGPWVGFGVNVIVGVTSENGVLVGGRVALGRGVLVTVGGAVGEAVQVGAKVTAGPVVGEGKTMAMPGKVGGGNGFRLELGEIKTKAK